MLSEDTTWRDQFYDGHPKKEKSEDIIRFYVCYSKYVCREFG